MVEINVKCTVKCTVKYNKKCPPQKCRRLDNHDNLLHFVSILWLFQVLPGLLTLLCHFIHSHMRNTYHSHV